MSTGVNGVHLQQCTNSTAIRDMAGNCSVTDAANCCLAVASAIQVKENVGARLMGLATAFLIAVEDAGINAYELLTYARNCINQAEGVRPEFKGVADYINNEVLKSNNG